MPRVRPAAAAAAALLSTAAVAAAQTTTTNLSVAPSTPSTAAALTIDASGGSSADGFPAGITVSVTRGFKFDGKSVAALCDASAAQQNGCPADSKIGSGTVDVQVDGPFPGALGSGAYHGTSETFLSKPAQAGDLGGLVVVLQIVGQKFTSTGRIVPVASGPFGMQLVFDPLPSPAGALPPGYAATLKNIHTVVAATRVEKKVTRKARRRHGKVVRRHGRVVRRRVVRRIRHDLIRTPPTCTGQWAVQVAIRYPSRTDTIDSPIACKSG